MVKTQSQSMRYVRSKKKQNKKQGSEFFFFRLKYIQRSIALAVPLSVVVSTLIVGDWFHLDSSLVG